MIPARLNRWLQFCGSESNSLLDPVFFVFYICVYEKHQWSVKQKNRACVDQGHLPFTPSIWVEILGVNIQCSSFSKRKMVRSENVLASIGKFKRKRKNALIKSIAYSFWNVSNGMVCTISFSNQNLWVFCVNGKRPKCLIPRFRDRRDSLVHEIAERPEPVLTR